MMILPEYAKKRTDAKCYGRGVFIKKPKRKSLSGKICQSGTDGIQADFKRYSSENARIHLSCNMLAFDQVLMHGSVW
jgi:hypothetical protein